MKASYVALPRSRPALELYDFYETVSKIYVIASDYNRTVFNVMKLDRPRDATEGDKGGEKARHSTPKGTPEDSAWRDAHDPSLDTSTGQQDEEELGISEDAMDYTYVQLSMLVDTLRAAKTNGFRHLTSGYGILGFIRFTKGYNIIIITRRKKVARLGPHNIYEIEDTEFHPLFVTQKSLSLRDDESRYRDMFMSFDTRKNFFFSYTYDLTHTLQFNCQRVALQKQQDTNLAVYEDMYTFNSYLLREFQRGLGDCNSKWVLPCIYGHLSQLTLEAHVRKVRVILIARRSRHFAGPRFFKRGMSDEGHVANHIETEQIVYDASSLSLGETVGQFTSFVQMRGSIPIYWKQEFDQRKNLVSRPAIKLGRSDPENTATRLHFAHLFASYGTPVIALDLLKQKEKNRRETDLGIEYSNTVSNVNAALPAEHKIQYIAWDFRDTTRVGGGDMAKNVLGSIAEEAIAKTGFFQSGPDVQEQKGIIRTNCVDCLDRTNIAQSTIGQCVLARQLMYLGIAEPRTPLIDKEVGVAIWEQYIELGDQIALQYGGSRVVGAGVDLKRSDILQSISRYYSNHFFDSDKQKAMNVFLGNYRRKRLPPQQQQQLQQQQQHQQLQPNQLAGPSPTTTSAGGVGGSGAFPDASGGHKSPIPPPAVHGEALEVELQSSRGAMDSLESTHVLLPDAQALGWRLAFQRPVFKIGVSTVDPIGPQWDVGGGTSGNSAPRPHQGSMICVGSFEGGQSFSLQAEPTGTSFASAPARSPSELLSDSGINSLRHKAPSVAISDGPVGDEHEDLLLPVPQTRPRGNTELISSGGAGRTVRIGDVTMPIAEAMSSTESRGLEPTSRPPAERRDAQLNTARQRCTTPDPTLVAGGGGGTHASSFSPTTHAPDLWHIEDDYYLHLNTSATFLPPPVVLTHRWWEVPLEIFRSRLTTAAGDAADRDRPVARVSMSGGRSHGLMHLSCSPSRAALSNNSMSYDSLQDSPPLLASSHPHLGGDPAVRNSSIVSNSPELTGAGDFAHGVDDAVNDTRLICENASALLLPTRGADDSSQRLLPPPTVAVTRTLPAHATKVTATRERSGGIGGGPPPPPATGLSCSDRPWGVATVLNPIRRGGDEAMVQHCPPSNLAYWTDPADDSARSRMQNRSQPPNGTHAQTLFLDNTSASSDPAVDGLRAALEGKFTFEYPFMCAGRAGAVGVTYEPLVVVRGSAEARRDSLGAARSNFGRSRTLERSVVAPVDTWVHCNVLSELKQKMGLSKAAQTSAMRHHHRRRCMQAQQRRTREVFSVHSSAVYEEYTTMPVALEQHALDELHGKPYQRYIAECLSSYHLRRRRRQQLKEQWLVAYNVRELLQAAADRSQILREAALRDGDVKLVVSPGIGKPQPLHISRPLELPADRDKRPAPHIFSSQANPLPRPPPHANANDGGAASGGGGGGVPGRPAGAAEQQAQARHQPPKPRDSKSDVVARATLRYGDRRVLSPRRRQSCSRELPLTFDALPQCYKKLAASFRAADTPEGSPSVSASSAPPPPAVGQRRQISVPPLSTRDRNRQESLSNSGLSMRTAQAAMGSEGSGMANDGGEYTFDFRERIHAVSAALHRNPCDELWKEPLKIYTNYAEFGRNAKQPPAEAEARRREAFYKEQYLDRPQKVQEQLCVMEANVLRYGETFPEQDCGPVVRGLNRDFADHFAKRLADKCFEEHMREVVDVLKNGVRRESRMRMVLPTYVRGRGGRLKPGASAEESGFAPAMVPQIFDQTFLAREVVEFVVGNVGKLKLSKRYFNARNQRDLAIAFLDKLLRCGVFYHAVQSDLSPRFAENFQIFRFVEDEPLRVLNTMRSHEAQPSPKELSSPNYPILLSQTLLRKALNAYRAFPEKEGDDPEVVRTYLQTPDFTNFSKYTCNLQHVNLSLLTNDEQKITFWVNIYNVLEIHAQFTIGGAFSMHQAVYRSTSCYLVGGMVFSLDTIQHGILRGNRRGPSGWVAADGTMSHRLFRPFAPDDPRKHLCVKEVDFKAHFALLCLTSADLPNFVNGEAEEVAGGGQLLKTTPVHVPLSASRRTDRSGVSVMDNTHSPRSTLSGPRSGSSPAQSPRRPPSHYDASRFDTDLRDPLYAPASPPFPRRRRIPFNMRVYPPSKQRNSTHSTLADNEDDLFLDFEQRPPEQKRYNVVEALLGGAKRAPRKPPINIVLDVNTLEMQLKDITSKSLQWGVQVCADHDARVLSIPHLFFDYEEDFGSTQEAKVKALATLMDGCRPLKHFLRKHALFAVKMLPRVQDV